MSALSSSATVAVVGAGTMGAGIAQVAAMSGHDVLMFDVKDGAAKKARDGIIGALAKLAAKGKISEQDRQRVAARLHVVRELAALGRSALVVEAVAENLSTKQSLFCDLEAVVSDSTILATNTSALSITAIGAGLKKPGRFAGLHFFNPVPLMALVEVVAGLASEPNVLATLSDTVIAWGKFPVATKSTPGFIVNRIARPFYAEGLRLLEEGAADAATIDAILKEAGGFRMGPFELMDLIGHDVNFAVTMSMFQACFNDPRYRPSQTQQALVEAGWLGRKSGCGSYDYAQGASRPDPQTYPVQALPLSVSVFGALGVAEQLTDLFARAGIAVSRERGSPTPVGAFIRIDGATLALTDGRTATARVAAGGPQDLVLFDLALDYSRASRIAIAAADQASPEALGAAAGLFQALGMKVSVIDDTPGLVVTRTVAMLVNEASETMLQRIATAADIDQAMKLGVNYPEGPLRWADYIGLDHVLAVLEALHSVYGDDRYRPSSLLRRRVANRNAMAEVGITMG